MIQDLYERHFEELRRYCLQLCRSGDMAFDLVQETFLKALEREEAMVGYSPEQQRSWLYKAARNLFLDGMRRTALLQRKHPTSRVARSAARTTGNSTSTCLRGPAPAATAANTPPRSDRREW